MSMASGLKELIGFLVREAIRETGESLKNKDEDDVDEMSSVGAVVGYTLPLGAKPPTISDPGRRTKRLSPARAAGKSFGNAR